MEIVKYYRFTEYNEHEGETWNFYLPLSSKELEKFIQVEKIFIDTCNSCYEFDGTPIPEYEIDILIKHAIDGYIPSHNKVSTINFDSVDRFIDSDDLDFDPFYKGACFNG